MGFHGCIRAKVIVSQNISKERKHSWELAEKIVVLADQAQQLQLAQMVLQSALSDTESDPLPAQPQRKSWWNRIFRR